MVCPKCQGAGHWQYGPYRQKICRQCGGKGKGKFLPVLRWNAGPDDLEEMRRTVASLPSNVRVQKSLRLVERGGAVTNGGSAIIVCGVHGEILQSTYGEHTSLGDHAVFFVKEALVIDYGQNHQKGDGDVSYVAIDPSAEQGIGVKAVKLWHFSDSGNIVTFPNNILGERTDIRFPTAAVKAAQGKARCYHCRVPFYAAGTTGQGLLDIKSGVDEWIRKD